MMIRWDRFNIYFVLLLVTALSCGCKSAETKRRQALGTLGLHLVVNPDPTKRSELVTVHRDPFIQFNVETAAFVTEGMIKEAKVIDVMGGFDLSLQFNRQGAWLLEEYTGANRGGHFAVFSQWAEPPGKKLNKGRWLGAPKITKLIKDGLLIFTPDATREEAEQIALGLNNVARKLGTGQKFDF